MSQPMMLRSQKVLMLAFFVTTGGKATAKTGGATIAYGRSNFEDPFASLDDEFDSQQDDVYSIPSNAYEDKVGITYLTDSIDTSFWGLFCLDLLIFAVIASGVRYFRASNCKGCTHEALAKLQEVAPAPPLVPVLPPPQRHAVVDFAPLMKAARADDEVVWKQLVEDMDDVILTCEDICQCTVLHVAAHTGCVELAKVLLQRGCNANAKEAWDETPLHFAARSGNVDVCKMLLAYDARINAVDASGMTPLIAAARANQEETCELLLDNGAGCGGVVPEGMPPLLSALLLNRIILPRRNTTLEST